jgi:MFS transporter, ACDE family, multidrug resistance protein
MRRHPDPAAAVWGPGPGVMRTASDATAAPTDIALGRTSSTVNRSLGWSAVTTAGRPPLALIFAVTVTGIIGNSLIAPAMPDLLDEFGVPDSAAGPVFAATSFPGIVMAPVIGVLADRFGRRAVLVPCLAVFGLSGLLVAIAPTYALLLAARFGMGFGAAGLINLSVVLIGDHWEGAERTRIIGRNAAVLTVSLAISPVVAGAVTDLAGWRWAVAPYGVGLVMAVIAWRVLDGGRPAHVTFREQMSGLGPVVRSPIVVGVLTSGTIVFILVFGGFLTIMPLHLERVFGLGASARGIMLSTPAIAASLVAFNLGRIRAAVPLRPLLIAAAAALGGGFAVLAGAPGLVVLVVGASLYGLGEGLLIPALQDVAVQTAPAQHRGAVVAVWVGAARLGQTLGPALAGASLAAFSTTGALVGAAALGAVLIIVVAIGPLRERVSDPLRESA